MAHLHQKKTIALTFGLALLLILVGFDCHDEQRPAPATGQDSNRLSSISSESISKPDPARSSTDGQIRGTFRCKDGIYDAFEFRSADRVVIHGLGLTFPTTYTREGKYIYIRTDKEDLSLEILSPSRLRGESWADGIYILRAK